MNCLLQFPPSLMSMGIKRSADHFENSFRNVYSLRLNEIKEEEAASFGHFSKKPFRIIMLIIEELIRRERCSYEYLKVLLPKEAVMLTCDEDKDYSPFTQHSLELIRKRCLNFKTLHLHKDFRRQGVEETTNFNETLKITLLKLGQLKELSLYDCFLELETFHFISRCCPNLEELNLRHTNITENGLAILHEKNSVLNKLQKLFIDDTDLSGQSIGRCLLHFRNLTYFLSDRTILAAYNLFERSPSKNKSENAPKFFTTIIKHKFSISDYHYFPADFEEWVIESFPEVKHLILISITEHHTFFVNRVITAWKNITHLELSSDFRRGSNSFDDLKDLLANCATSGNLIFLKLESFSNVDVKFLGGYLKNLKKLSLINNKYRHIEQNDQTELFENLLEVEIILIKYDVRNAFYPDAFFQHMPPESLKLVLAAKKLEKVYIHNQWYFTNDYLKHFLGEGHLQDLKEFNVFYCQIRIDSIKELFIQQIPIEKIVLGLCPFIRVNDIDKLSDYIRINNFKASITLTSQVPYHLRWTTLNIPNTI